ncbi:MAG: DUF1674 domain-containing protein [Gammaproteobacteria bacterium]|nr:DUF1674 domain-containing protein [Gammaproteobacteria bacterium]
MPEMESKDEPAPVETDDEQSGEDTAPPREYGGPKGKEPTRYGDWEKNGRCIDF